MPGRPLSEDELRTLREMMSEYVQRRAVDAWFSVRWKKAVIFVGAISATAVIVSSIVSLWSALG